MSGRMGLKTQVEFRKYGRLFPVKRAADMEDGKVMWEFNCDCGSVVVKPVYSVVRHRGDIKSCGCLRLERAVAAVRKHGALRTPEYRIWQTMIRRCIDPKQSSYKNYGARGITVCDRWRQSFVAFLEDVGRRPYPKATIDRIDNDRGYEPGNVRWASRIEQMRNCRTSRLITFQGRTETVLQWSVITGIPYKTIYNRLNKGLPPEEALKADYSRIRRKALRD